MSRTPAPRKRGVNVLGLLWAGAFALVAIAGFTGEITWIFRDATAWVAAGLVALAGVYLLVTAVPRRQR